MNEQYKYLSDNEKEALEHLVDSLHSTLGGQIVMLKLFGSKVRGDYSKYSDIDVFLVVKERRLELIEKIAELNLDIDLEHNTNISLIIYSEYEYLANKKLDTPFIETVLSEGVSL